MPQFPAGTGGAGTPQAEGPDYRTNLFVPAGMEAVTVENETYETVCNPNGKKNVLHIWKGASRPHHPRGEC